MITKKIILTIDDDKFIRKSFRIFLEKNGYDVLDAENGSQGIEIFNKYAPDVVLLDLNMPIMSGLEVLDVLVKESPETPVIVISGVGIIDDVLEAIHRGAWDYIMKPIHSFSILEYTIGKVLEKSLLILENNKYQEMLEEMVNDRTRKLEHSNIKLFKEIESRKSIEVELNNSKQMLSSIIKTVPDIIYRLDDTGTINFISNAIENYGYNPNDLINKSIFDYVHPDDYEQSYWHLKERRTNERKTKNFEVRFFKSLNSGSEPVFMLESEGIYSDNNGQNFIGTQGVARDISQRKEAENKMKKSLMEKEALLREVHHRVKNNMQVILSLLNIQIREIDNEEIKEILQASQNRILSMAIVHESIYNTENFAQINMTSFVRNLYLQIAKSYKVHLKIEIEFIIEKMLISLDSSVPLAIIMNELFTNIFKHAFKDYANAKIKVEMKKISKSKSIIIIEDNGIGFPDNINPKDPKTMGLSLIKILTSQINGEVNVERLKKGTRTSIIFQTNIVRSGF